MKKFKLMIIPAIEKSYDNIEFDFNTKEELLAAQNSCADLLLFIQDKVKVMKNYSNMFESLEFIEFDGDGEWCELDDY